MEIKYLGHSSFEINWRRGLGGSVTVVTDPFDPKMVGLSLKKETKADLLLVSHEHADHNFRSGVGGNPFVVAGPGEYEVKGVKVVGVASFHDNEMGKARGKNTIYSFEIGGVFFCHLGDLGQENLTEEQLSAIGKVDVLFAPVGGFYTIDAKQAVAVVSQLEPLIVIPMHYKVPGLPAGFDKISEVGEFTRELGKPFAAIQDKPSKTEGILKIEKDKLPLELEVVVLERA